MSCTAYCLMEAHSISVVNEYIYHHGFKYCRNRKQKKNTIQHDCYLPLFTVSWRKMEYQIATSQRSPAGGEEGVGGEWAAGKEGFSVKGILGGGFVERTGERTSQVQLKSKTSKKREKDNKTQRPIQG